MTREDAIKAAADLKDYCDKTRTCKDCPFCRFTLYGAQICGIGEPHLDWEWKHE